MLVLRVLYTNNIFGDASSHWIPTCRSICIQWGAAALEIPNASLKPFRVVSGQLALNISVYHSASISAGVTAKIKPPREQKTADLGLGHDNLSLPLPSNSFILLSICYFYPSSLQKSFSWQNIKIKLERQLSLHFPCPP